MGNVVEKLTDLGQNISQTATDVSKRVTCLIAAPSKPIPMLDLGDGRTADEMRTAAEVMYSMDTKTCVNIGFLGPSNELKTSLINSLRYLADSRPDCGIINPNNNAVQYIHCDPSYRHIRFWDVHDKEGSFIDRCLYAFDTVILVTQENLRQDDLQMIREGGKLQPPYGVLIVRAGMDRYFDTQFSLDPSSKDTFKGKTEHGAIIKDNLKSQMRQGGLDPCSLCEHCFLVSAPGMLAARGVNFDGVKYLWDEFDLLSAMVDCVAKRRY